MVKALGVPKGEWTKILPDFNKIQFIQDDDEYDDDQDQHENRFPRWLQNIRSNHRVNSTAEASSSSSKTTFLTNCSIDQVFKEFSLLESK